MNLIVNRQLDRSQELAIHELTLKKRASKKLHMSEKQQEAKRQLAHELSQERKVPLLVESIRQTLRRFDSIASNASSLASTSTNSQSDYQSPANMSSCSSSTASGEPSCGLTFDLDHQNHHHNQNCQDQSYNQNHLHEESSATIRTPLTPTLIATANMSEELMAEVEAQQQQYEQEFEAKRRQANIKFNQIRLDQLNGELEAKLKQYEYLVAQEKALLIYTKCSQSRTFSKSLSSPALRP